MILHYAVHILSKMNPLTHTKNELAGWIIIIVVVVVFVIVVVIFFNGLHVLYRSNWDMISNAVFVMPLIVCILTVYAL